MRCGGALISPKHANFVLNRGDASASDVRELIETVQQAVEARYGVSLELEIELVGEW
jgi:UDP-N-acetylmuramate dehydrogenase